MLVSQLFLRVLAQFCHLCWLFFPVCFYALSQPCPPVLKSIPLTRLVCSVLSIVFSFNVIDRLCISRISVVLLQCLNLHATFPVYVLKSSLQGTEHLIHSSHFLVWVPSGFSYIIQLLSGVF